ncbi:MAG: hypothetical protein ACYTGR_01510 [Planctomycetota bacterium]
MSSRPARARVAIVIAAGVLAAAVGGSVAVRAWMHARIPVVEVVSGPAMSVEEPLVIAHGADLPHQHRAALLHPPLGGRLAGADCACDTARRIDGWCPACGVGYLAGTSVPSALLFDAIDPHGHVFDPASIECESCQAAIADEGFCLEHGRGFAHGLLYASRLTWGLSRSGRADPGGCGPACGTRSGDGWCPAGAHGTIGNRGFADQAAFEMTAEDMERLRASIGRLERCEPCAIASLLDGRCRGCKIQWRAGHPVQEPETSRHRDRSRQGTRSGAP